MPSIDIGAQITKARKLRGWSQVDFEKHTGVRRQLISKWERNAGGLTLPSLLKVGEALGVPANILLRDAMRAAALRTTLAPEIVEAAEAQASKATLTLVRRRAA